MITIETALMNFINALQPWTHSTKPLIDVTIDVAVYENLRRALAERCEYVQENQALDKSNYMIICGVTVRKGKNYGNP